MNDFIAISDLDMRIDCNFIAEKITTIKSNSIIEKICEVGPWLKVKYNELIGWIYPFDDQSRFLLETNITHDFRIGDAVIINTKKDTYIDTYGKTIVCKKNKQNLYFLIVELLSNPKLIRIKNASKDEYYWVKPADIEKIDIPSVSNNNEFSFFQEISNGIDSVKNAFTGIFTNSSTNPAQTPTQGYNPDLENLGNATALMKSWTSQEVLDEDGCSWGNAREKLAKFSLSNLRVIFGMPYQYMPIADMRFGNVTLRSENDIGARVEHNEPTIANLGAKYAEKIVGRMPLMIMVPGVADFMAGFAGQDRENMLKEMIGSYGGDINNAESYINDFTTSMKGTRASFYNMYPAWVEYYKYVNPLCWAAAKFMGVQKYVIPGSNNKPLEYANWLDIMKNPAIHNNPAYHGACSFYIQSDNQVTENISNSTTQPAIASKVNTVSEQGRELMFLSSSVDGILNKAVEGAAKVGKDVTSVAQGGASTVMSKFTGTTLVNQFEKSGGAFNAILDGINNSIAGSKMLFPDLWQDSQFTRNYSFRIKLDSPDNDPLSLYLNIIVPLIHIICFAAPRNMGPTTYASPFLIKAYYQGFFNINMGIISDMSIVKGAEGAWTLKNVPTVVEVSMDIKDLFANNLTISKTQNLDLNLITNTPLLDYIGNMCGININEPDWTKVLYLYKMLVKGEINSYATNLFARLVNYIYAGRQNVYQSILAGNFNPLRSRS